jgi:hypothetical protein
VELDRSQPPFFPYPNREWGNEVGGSIKRDLGTYKLIGKGIMHVQPELVVELQNMAEDYDAIDFGQPSPYYLPDEWGIFLRGWVGNIATQVPEA